MNVHERPETGFSRVVRPPYVPHGIHLAELWQRSVALAHACGLCPAPRPRSLVHSGLVWLGPVGYGWTMTTGWLCGADSARDDALRVQRTSRRTVGSSEVPQSRRSHASPLAPAAAFAVLLSLGDGHPDDRRGPLAERRIVRSSPAPPPATEPNPSSEPTPSAEPTPATESGNTAAEPRARSRRPTRRHPRRPSCPNPPLIPPPRRTPKPRPRPSPPPASQPPTDEAAARSRPVATSSFSIRRPNRGRDHPPREARRHQGRSPLRACRSCLLGEARCRPAKGAPSDPSVVAVVPDEVIGITAQTTPTGVSRVGARLSATAEHR